MNEPIFLISGATGATGGAAAEQLLAKKRHVRVLAHRHDDRSERLKQLGPRSSSAIFSSLRKCAAP